MRFVPRFFQQSDRMAKAKLHILSAKELDAETWDDFVASSFHGSFYAQHAYLSMLREDWQAYIVEDKGEWQVVMPFVVNQRWKYRSIPQLPFTQYLGPMFAAWDNLPTYKRYSNYQKYFCNDLRKRNS